VVTVLFGTINPRSPTPLHAQIAEQVRQAIVAGELAPGDALPAIGALAARLRVNPATIAHAFRELERDGLAVPSDGAGGPLRVAQAPQLVASARRVSQAAESERSSELRAVRRDALTRLEAGVVVDGRFELGRLLGAGAMGAVYLAHDRELDEEVAMKVLPPLLGDDGVSERRFLNEIRVARRISHRNVVRTHDVGRWSGGLYLTMEYVRGITLRELLDTRGPLPESDVRALGVQLADALAVAHDQGVIHRDVKPQNLLLDDAGTLKVLDFGIAVMQGSHGHLTEVGLVVGTPAYMSPEQLFGEPLTPAADLYSAGVVLYECLSGCRPVEAASPMSLIARIVSQGPTPILDVAPGTSRSLGETIMHLLRPVASRSPAGAAALADLLRRGP